MAGDWIPQQKGLSRKPEVLAVAKQVGKHRRWVAQTLMEFWEWVDAESADGCVGVCLGDLPGLISETDMVFWQAVLSVGWLRVTTRGIAIPHFERWLGRSAKKRLLDSQRKAQSRAVPFLSALKTDKSVTPVLYSSVLSSEGVKEGLREPSGEEIDFGTFVGRVRAACPTSADWWPEAIARHCWRFCFHKPDDPVKVADWWQLMDKLKVTRDEFEAASQELLAVPDPPKGRPDHPRRIVAIVKTCRRQAIMFTALPVGNNPNLPVME